MAETSPGRPRGVKVIDLYPLAREEVETRFPAIYQHVLERVKPERDQNNMKFRRENWWWFGATHKELRAFLDGLPRYIATIETAKHRFFEFLDGEVRPDNKLINIGSDDAALLAVLSSSVHCWWFQANAGKIGVYALGQRLCEDARLRHLPPSRPASIRACPRTIRKRPCGGVCANSARSSTRSARSASPPMPSSP